MTAALHDGMTPRQQTEFHRRHFRLMEETWRNGDRCRRLGLTGSLTQLGLTYREDGIVIVWSGGDNVIVVPDGGDICTRQVAYTKGEMRQLVVRMTREGLACMRDIAARYRAGELRAPGVPPREPDPIEPDAAPTRRETQLVRQMMGSTTISRVIALLIAPAPNPLLPRLENVTSLPSAASREATDGMGPKSLMDVDDKARRNVGLDVRDRDPRPSPVDTASCGSTASDQLDLFRDLLEGVGSAVYAVVQERSARRRVEHVRHPRHNVGGVRQAAVRSPFFAFQ